MRLTVNFGDQKRTILAGIRKERANPREVEGRQALFIVNLEARKMAGELSEGMLFDIGYADGVTPALAVPERPVPNGTRAGWSFICARHAGNRQASHIPWLRCRDRAQREITRIRPGQNE